MKYNLIIIYIIIFIIVTYLIYQLLKTSREPMDGYSVTVENSSGLSNFLNMFSKKDPPVEIDIDNTRTRKELTILPKGTTNIKPPYGSNGENEDELTYESIDELPDKFKVKSKEIKPKSKSRIVKSPEYCAFNYGTKDKNMLLVCPEDTPYCNGYSYDRKQWGSCSYKPTTIPKTIPNGEVWSSRNEQDINHEAYCHCVNTENTKGISLCKNPPLVVKNKMTFSDCTKQCKRLNMHMISTESEMKTAATTGCNKDSETWVDETYLNKLNKKTPQTAEEARKILEAKKKAKEQAEAEAEAKRKEEEALEAKRIADMKAEEKREQEEAEAKRKEQVAADEKRMSELRASIQLETQAAEDAAVQAELAIEEAKRIKEATAEAARKAKERELQAANEAAARQKELNDQAAKLQEEQSKLAQELLSQQQLQSQLNDKATQLENEKARLAKENEDAKKREAEIEAERQRLEQANASAEEKRRNAESAIAARERRLQAEREAYDIEQQELRTQQEKQQADQAALDAERKQYKAQQELDAAERKRLEEEAKQRREAEILKLETLKAEAEATRQRRESEAEEERQKRNAEAAAERERLALEAEEARRKAQDEADKKIAQEKEAHRLELERQKQERLDSIKESERLKSIQDAEKRAKLDSQLKTSCVTRAKAQFGKKFVEGDELKEISSETAPYGCIVRCNSSGPEPAQWNSNMAGKNISGEYLEVTLGTVQEQETTKENCLQRSLIAYGDKVTDGKKCLQSGKFEDAPPGCSVKNGDDWAAYWNDNKDDINGMRSGDYTTVGSYSEVKLAERQRLNGAASNDDKADCLQRAITQFGSKVTDSRNQLQMGEWSDKPYGCSVESGGDWAAHWNDNKNGKEIIKGNMNGNFTISGVSQTGTTYRKGRRRSLKTSRGGDYIYDIIESNGYCLVLEKNGSLRLIKGDKPQGPNVIWSFESCKPEGRVFARFDDELRRYVIHHNSKIIWSAPPMDKPAVPEEDVSWLQGLVIKNGYFGLFSQSPPDWELKTHWRSDDSGPDSCFPEAKYTKVDDWKKARSTEKDRLEKEKQLAEEREKKLIEEQDKLKKELADSEQLSAENKKQLEDRLKELQDKQLKEEKDSCFDKAVSTVGNIVKVVPNKSDVTEINTKYAPPGCTVYTDSGPNLFTTYWNNKENGTGPESYVKIGTWSEVNKLEKERVEGYKITPENCREKAKEQYDFFKSDDKPYIRTVDWMPYGCSFNKWTKSLYWNTNEKGTYGDNFHSITIQEDPSTPTTQKNCLQRAVTHFGSKVTAKRNTLQVGKWDHLPEGCSVQSGSDWAAHWNLRNHSNNSMYSTVFESDPKDPITKENCRERAIAQFGSKVTNARGGRLMSAPNTTAWPHIPRGCTVQVGGNWAAHWNPYKHQSYTAVPNYTYPNWWKEKYGKK